MCSKRLCVRCLKFGLFLFILVLLSCIFCYLNWFRIFKSQILYSRSLLLYLLLELEQKLSEMWLSYLNQIYECYHSYQFV
jgi:hypothetical protein